MRVDPSATHTPLAAANQPPRPAAPTPDAAAPAKADPVSFHRTTDFTKLMQALRGEPEVRGSVVASVLARLASGEFDSPQAARETAAAMLGRAPKAD